MQQWQEVHSSSDSLAAALSTLYQNLLTKWREEVGDVEAGNGED